MADQEEALYLNPPRIATAGRKLEEMAKMANIMESQGVSNDHMKQMVGKTLPSIIHISYSGIFSKLSHILKPSVGWTIKYTRSCTS